MSIAVMSWVWSSSKAAGIDRLVLLAIADAASDDGGNAYPSVATIARKAAVSPRTVQRSIRALCELGELKMNQGAGRAGSNLYRVVMRQSDTPVTVSPRQVDIRQNDASPVNQSQRGVNLTQTPRPADTRTILEPSLTERAPSQFCSKHPAGTDKPCQACGSARLRFAAWSKAQPQRAAAARALAAECSQCHGSNWIDDDNGKPVRKCDHKTLEVAL